MGLGREKREGNQIGEKNEENTRSHHEKRMKKKKKTMMETRKEWDW